MVRQGWLVRRVRAACLALTVVAGGALQAEARQFEEAEMILEQNATDEDVEVVLRIKGGNEGLKQLRVTAPDGSTVFEFQCPISMGLRSFNLESPEPRDTKRLLAAYPEGNYAITGLSVSGASHEATVQLTHTLPDVVRITHPREDAEDVATEGLRIQWQPAAGAQGYILELEQEELGTSFTVTLPADARIFAVPAGFLRPGMETMLAIGTVASSGNTSFVEIGFETED